MNVVYKNLNRGDWSVAALRGSHSCGKVLGHTDSIVLADCTLHVQESARQRVCRNKCREVHAWVIGRIASERDLWGTLSSIEVTYNPYRAGKFTTRGGVPIERARFIEFRADGRAIAWG